MNRARRLTRYWDRVAQEYDSRMAGLERRFLAASRPWVCARTEGRTLELCVGTGKNFEHYFPENVELTAVELSPAMLEIARSAAVAAGIEVDLRIADAADLPFDDGTFQTVVCTFGLCGVRNHRRVLAEAFRVLRPGGTLLLADHVGATFVPLRIAQHLMDLGSIPFSGEHYARRPIRALPAIGFEIKESQRFARGALEHVRAVKPV